MFLDQNQRNVTQDHDPALRHHEAQSLSSGVFVLFPTALAPLLKIPILVIPGPKVYQDLLTVNQRLTNEIGNHIQL